MESTGTVEPQLVMAGLPSMQPPPKAEDSASEGSSEGHLSTELFKLYTPRPREGEEEMKENRL